MLGAWAGVAGWLVGCWLAGLLVAWSAGWLAGRAASRVFLDIRVLSSLSSTTAISGAAVSVHLQKFLDYFN